jgi:His/Glu/Gln/Arg/opine family amino acid ABC transporter permease subunit
MGYQIDLKVIFDNMDEFVLAIGMTLVVSAVSLLVALVLGLIVAFMRISKVRPLSMIAQGYTNFFQGAPLYVLIFWVYYGVAMILNVNFKPFTAGVIALSTQYGAFLAEIYRSGIEAIGRGQREAAVAMGLTTPQTYRYIILPQAIRIVLPSLGNMWISIIKDSSLLSVIGVMEIMRTAYFNANDYFRPFEFYTVAAILYIALTFTFHFGNQALERRLRIGR